MENPATSENVLTLAKQLTVADKARLIERLAPEVARELESKAARPRRNLRGLWRGLDITKEDIAEVRREMWGGFPREDI